MNVLIVGGGVAGLEALLGLRAMAGDRVDLTLAAPDRDFSYRPLAVAEPFALGHAYRVPLSQFTDDVGAQLVVDATVGIDDAAGKVRLRESGERSFDAFIVAPGAHAVSGVEGAVTWWPGGDPETFSGLLRDIDEGYSKRIAIVVPPGAVWPLPAYELAVMTAGQAKAMGHDDVTITVVTPERRALSLFGDEASAAVTDELAHAGVQLKTGVVGLRDKDGLKLEPGGERLDAQRIYSVPRLVGPALEGLPADDEGFILAGDDARVEGCERTWAAGDAVVSPIKFGGLATHQARRAAAAIARLAGVEDAPDPGEPVLHGRLMTGRRMRSLSGRGDAEGAPLWWPQGKVAGEYLPRWLTEHGVAPPAAEEPADEGITVHRPLSELREPEVEYLSGLAREFRSADPAIASLGRRMREARGR
jgi:sulfide:quinone oxidoreductase